MPEYLEAFHESVRFARGRGVRPRSLWSSRPVSMYQQEQMIQCLTARSVVIV